MTLHPVLSVAIEIEAIDPGALLGALQRDAAQTGAVASFSGYVRGEGISRLALEHYPGMTERAIQATMVAAAKRWPLQTASVVHRVGELDPGDPIVWVGVASAHRAAAFAACEYIMDFLKVSATLWKRECDLEGRWRWVDARSSDEQAAQRWSRAPNRPT